ncbi:MAG: RNA methyltransferase [Cryobacterium sp.]|nr:RNA methyltransferase [Oligoflexia bacterium]
MSIIHVRNPHSVLAALERRPDDVLSVQISPSTTEDAWKKVSELARKLKIGTHQVAPEAGSRRGGRPADRISRDEPKEGGRASGNEARIKSKDPLSAADLFANARERAGGKGIWLALDSLTDPHNVGAIFRIAGFFGIEGILMTSERSAPLTGTVYDVSCGGVETVPHTEQVNLQRALEVAKEAGLWVLGTSEHAKTSYLDLKRDCPWLIVIGNEEKGMRRLTAETCDVTVGIPPIGEVTSLNASVASAVLISRLASLT